MEATPAKWNVFNVICVPGSPILWAHRAPTAVPGSILALEYFSLHRFRKSTSWDLVQRSNQDNTDKKQINNSIFTVFFFIQVLSTLTLTAIKLRLDEIVLFPHLLTRVDGLNAYLRLMHKCPDIFENVDVFRSPFSKKYASTLSVFDSLSIVHTKTLKRWQYDSIPYSAYA